MEHIPPGQALHQYQVLMGNISSVLLEGFYTRQYCSWTPGLSPSRDINDLTATYSIVESCIW